MIDYLIKKADKSEDQLTGAVFGAMKYLPVELFLKRFIEKVYDENRRYEREAAKKTFAIDLTKAKHNLWKTVSLKDALKELCIEEEKYISYLVNILKKPEDASQEELRETRERVRKGSIEPDVIIDSETHLIIIEAERSKSYEADQMCNQYVWGVYESQKTKKEFIHIVLNDRWESSIVKNISKNIENIKYLVSGKYKKEFHKAEDRILWFNWQNISTIVEDACKKLYGKKDKNKLLLEDLKYLLISRYKYRPFRHLDSKFIINKNFLNAKNLFSNPLMTESLMVNFDYSSTLFHITQTCYQKEWSEVTFNKKVLMYIKQKLEEVKNG